MTKSEFLAQLKKALQGNLSSSAVQENMDYYDRYILRDWSSDVCSSDLEVTEALPLMRIAALSRIARGRICLL